MAVAFGFAGAADFLAERAIVETLAPGERVVLVPHVLALTCFRNARSAMGVFGDRPALFVLLALAVLAAIALALSARMRRSSLAQVGYALVAGGSIGNVVERAINGYVVDFIALPSFFVFNVGDVFIACGLVLLALPALGASR